jgi:SAM-dependent methyltransferase
MSSFNYTGTDNLEVMAEAANYNRYLFDLLTETIRPPACVVDFGAGIGTFARQLAVEGHRVLCIEPDQDQNSVISELGIPVFRHLDEIADDSVDFLYTFNVLEHIEDDLEVIELFKRKLRSGGQVLIYVPAFPILYSSMDLKVGHVRRYRRHDLASKVTSAGLEISHAQYADCAGFFASLVFKIVGNDSGNINRRALIAYDRFVFPMSRRLDSIFGDYFGKNLILRAFKL